MSDAVLLVRHTAVALRWAGRCYGHSDVGLSRAGAIHAAQLVEPLAAWRPEVIIHSDMKRTRVLAERLAARVGIHARRDPAWRERDFGSWEAQPWSAIYAATGEAMMGMVDAPSTFRPGGGETTCDLADRVVAAFAALPAGRVLIVTHGGPIAAVRGRLSRADIAEWLELVPKMGEAIELRRPAVDGTKIKGDIAATHDTN